MRMDLCGPKTCRESQWNKYILVIVDDYSRFTWVKCLRSKDEAPALIINFLKMIQVRLKETVCRIRTDNGTEFVNQTLREYYEKVGISHETSVARSSAAKRSAYRKALKCGKKDLSVSKRNRTSGTLVSQGLFLAITNIICSVGQADVKMTRRSTSGIKQTFG
ncbi:retrovirus-related pol polyprotein from transposon TNT 1-94 [Tanacetum coccineum]